MGMNRIFNRVGLLVAALAFILLTPCIASASEAQLVLPDLRSATFFGINGHNLLLGGLLVCVLGLVFGMVIYAQVKKLPVHKSMLEVSVRYSNERVAFEKKIAKFQAVQHNLARLAGEVSAAMTAAYSAADAIARADKFDDAVFLEATAAKIRSAEAAQEGAAIAHQVHGAIGFTSEHILHRYTLRMLSWRDDFGNESYWAAELGRRVARQGADEFWPLVASR